MDLTRRRFLASSAALLQQPARRPNILFLLADDQRFDSLGCMGNRVIRTPHVDSLAARGTVFTNHFVSTAICVSSRASIFSGLYTRCHGIDEFSKQFSAAQLARTYPALLRAAGYRTGFIGKYGLDGGQLPEKGFDYWRGFRGQGNYFPQGEPGPHLTTVMGDQAQEFLESNRDAQPFCLSVSFKAPHVQDQDPRQFLPDPADRALYEDAKWPFPPAKSELIAGLPLSVQRSEARRRWAVRFSTSELFHESVRNYYRLITGVDRQVGRMLETLRRRGELARTLVVYTSDNGFYLGEFGLAGKWFMHEESIRVPLVMAGPSVAEGRRSDDLTLNIDLAPTLLASAGVAAPPSMQGRPVLDRSLPRREEFFYEHYFRSGGWIPATEGVRARDWKYTKYIDEPGDAEELFDLRKDPGELTNLARAGGGLLQRGRARREAWMSALQRWTPDAAWKDPA
jgi:arylsulfatase A-like enzyme